MNDSTRRTDSLFDIDGRVIAVAGAGSGLGRFIAGELGARGASVCLIDLDETALAQTAATIPGALDLRADICHQQSTEQALAMAVDRFGRLDAVVNAAGVLTIGAADKLDEADFRRCIDVNLTGAFLFSRAAARLMPKEGGRIVHIASVSSLVSNTEYAAYASSKAALAQLVRVLGREWAPRNILVNAIGPAVTETSMTAGHLTDPAFRDNALSVIPMGRFGRPEDLTGALLLLLAPAGGFITGQTIFVDGGRTLV